MSEGIERIYKKTEQYGRIQFVEEIDKLQCEKQQLISFLKDKIKKIENSQEVIINENEINITGKNIKLDLLNEILDFVNEVK